MKEPSIAVIVPNWNDARYLPHCLRSVLDQHVKPEELIVVDDQSTDDSVAVIRSLIADNPFAQLVENPENLGTNGALNEGLRRARSEYVLLLSANDYVLPGIFSRAKDCLARSPGVGLWSAMTWLVDEEDRPIRLHPSPVIALNDAVFPPERCVKLAQRFGNWFTGTTLIYHRNALQAAGGFDPAYGGLSDLVTSLVVASRHGAAYTPEPFAAVRMHSGSHLFVTLKDVARLDSILQRLSERGPQLSPQLFSAGFIERTALRLRFAAIRVSGGGLISDVAVREGRWKGAALRIAHQLIPASLRTVRVAVAFLVLRPFDILPTLYNRLLGWVVVRLLVQLRGRGLLDAASK